MILNIIIALLIVLGIADVVTTLKGLKAGDEEANPLAAWVFKLLGPVPGMLALKILCTAIIIGVVEVSRWWWLGAIFVVGYIYVLWNNVRVLREDRS